MRAPRGRIAGPPPPPRGRRDPWGRCRRRSICPDEWLTNWEELREAGNWFGKY
jgi:hypothetical protein